MKRFLFLISLLLIPPAVAGDLGKADFDSNRMVFDLSAKPYRKILSDDSFQFNCGANGTHMKKCEISFVDNLLKVNDSRGIAPEQVLHVSFTGNYVYLFYRDSADKIVRAGFGSLHTQRAIGFQSRLVKWMNRGLLDYPEPDIR